MSVADPLKLLEHDLKDPKFKGCSSTTEFIQNINRLFDFLNSRHPIAKGFKVPISNFNLTLQQNAIESIYNYLLILKITNNQLLYFHQHKTFILGFVSTTKSIITIQNEMEINFLFKYVLT